MEAQLSLLVYLLSELHIGVVELPLRNSSVWKLMKVLGKSIESENRIIYYIGLHLQLVRSHYLKAGSNQMEDSGYGEVRES